MFVKSIMVKPVITAHEDDTLREVAKKMLDNKVGCLPIVDSEGMLVGLVSESDFTAREHSIPFSRDRALQLFGRWMVKEEVEKMYETASSMKVSEIMSKPVFSIEQDEKIGELVRKMMTHNIHRLPVIKDGKPVGMVSRRDLLKLIIK